MSGPFPYNVGAGSQAHFQYLASLLEPLAIQPVLSGVFNHVIAPGATEYLLGAYLCSIRGLSTIGTVDPRQPLALSDVPLTGTSVNSLATVLDANATIYPNAQLAYQQRLAKLATLPTKTANLPAGNTYYDFLPGPYGSILTSHYNLNMQSLSLQNTKAGAAIFPFSWQYVDTVGAVNSRDQASYFFPVNKGSSAGILTGVPAAAARAGSINFVNLPANWSPIPDPFSNNYVFRDDFMGTTLDLTKWNVTAPGRAFIDPNWAWVNTYGNGGINQTGIISVNSVPRQPGRVLIVDVHIPSAAIGAGTSPETIFGFSVGGLAVANYNYGIYLLWGGANFDIRTITNGVATSDYFSGFTGGQTYRFRITLTATGATYEVQGLPEHFPIGGNNWRLLYTQLVLGLANLNFGYSIAGATGAYYSDFRII